MTFAELKEALKIFQLPERASLQEIKARHRLLVRRYHPDMGDQADPDKIRKINAAYRILMGYCSAYRFCLEPRRKNAKPVFRCSGVDEQGEMIRAVAQKG